MKPIAIYGGDPLEAVDCWCPDAVIEIHAQVEYCPRHGSQPDWSLVDAKDRARQRAIRGPVEPAANLCRCPWLGAGTPGHERTAFCTPIKNKEVGA